MTREEDLNHGEQETRGAEDKPPNEEDGGRRKKSSVRRRAGRRRHRKNTRISNRRNHPVFESAFTWRAICSHRGLKTRTSRVPHRTQSVWGGTRAERRRSYRRGALCDGLRGTSGRGLAGGVPTQVASRRSAPRPAGGWYHGYADRRPGFPTGSGAR